jgi:fibronectin type 3 domain-containing protein
LLPRVASLAILAAVGAAIAAADAHAASPPSGLTGFGSSARVELAWQPSAGASAYAVYRGTSATTVTARVSPAGGVLGTSFADTSAANGTTYFYAVRAIEAGIESTSSAIVSSTPAARACSIGNPTVLENCLPGSSGWPIRSGATVATGGIEGYATAQSINHGESVGLKVRAAAGTAYDIEVYRMGSYGGLGGRLVTTLRNLTAAAQPACQSNASTGLYECSNWSLSTTLTTTSAWPSGMYLLRLVRAANGSDGHILLTVRDDARSPDVMWGSAYSTFQAYNSYGGKSLYDFNSSGTNTVGGSPRAVKVSFDRPYEQTRSRQHDWFTETEQPVIGFLERQGFDMGYIAGTDLERRPGLALATGAYISPAHDEYIGGGMRGALEAARDAGHNLLFTGANAVFWRVRFEASPQSGTADRVLVCYKTSQYGVTDPGGVTGTWRDPAGANRPENALIGQMYVGENVTSSFPMRVPAAQGEDRLWRYTGLDAQPNGATESIGSDILGWEWDSRVANGSEPPGVKTLATSPVSGNILQNAGGVYSPGTASSNMTKYKAASGALVVSLGTNQFWRGLATNTFAEGNPDEDLQQFTVNTLVDMGAPPATPATGIELDTPPDAVARPTNPTSVAAGVDTIVVSWNAVPNATSYTVYRTRSARDGGYPLGARASSSAVTGTSFTDTGLAAGTKYYYVVTATVGGVQSAPSAETSATTATGGASSVRINAGGGVYVTQAGGSYDADRNFTGGTTYRTTRPISGTTDPGLYQDERWGDFSYAIPITNGTYDVRLHFAELYFGTDVAGGAGKRVFGVDVADTAASPDLANIDIYAAVGPNAALVRTIPTVKVTDGILNLSSVRGAADDPEITAVDVVPSAPSGPPTVTQRTPADGATGVVATVRPTATFSRDMDASTLTAATVTLERASDGAAVSSTVTYDAALRTVTLRPAAALAFNTAYRARISTGAKASDGTALASAVTWTFTTGSPPPPPTVTAVSPASGATGQARTVQPTATFSKDMDAATITGSSFRLERPDGSSVAATVSYDAATRVAKLAPSTSLAYATAYTARLTTAVTAADGAALAAPVAWSFTTADPPPPDTQAPTVSLIAPVAGATVTGTVRLAATAADNVGVAGVQFRVDGANAGSEDASAPYEYDWNTLSAAAGPHTLTAVARDDAGNTTVSAPVTVTVSNPTVDPSGLVAAFGFEETSGTTARDASSSHNDGAVTAALRSTQGRFGSALAFDGASDYVTVPDSNSLDLSTAMTLEAWVNPATLGGWRTVLLKERTAALAYGLYANGNPDRPSAHASVGNSEFDTRGTAQVAAATWTHLATTWDGATLRLFVNGTQVSSRALSGTLDSSSLPLRIGGNTVWGEWFNGRIDEVRVYRRALTAAEIQADMTIPVDSGSPPSAPGTLTAAVAADTVTLDWGAATDDQGVAEYRVHRSTTNGFTPSAANRIAQVTTGTTYADRNLAPGTYYYLVVAADAAGNTGPPSNERSATVTPDSTAPSVSITSPAAGATVSGTVPVAANAADDRNVTSVQFKVDGADVGAADTGAPYTVAWDTRTASAGTHTLTAVARDAAGNTKVSAAVGVSVDNGAPPTVSVTAPAAGATVSATVPVQANATDDRGVVSVQFKLDGGDLGAADTVAPYATSWNTTTASNGAHTLTAVARDTDGDTTTSAPVQVTVSNASPVPGGLVGAWGFDEATGTVATDASGHSLDGAIVGPTRTASGKFGRALTFDGTNDWVTVNDAPALHLTTGITLEAWVSPSRLTGWRTAVLKEQSAGLAWSLYANTDTNRPSAHVFTSAESEIRGAGTLALGAWSHLAMTYDGTAVRLYVNGTLAGTKAATGTLISTTQPLRFGGNGVWSEWFEGSLDEIRVYDRALSATELQADMTRPIS